MKQFRYLSALALLAAMANSSAKAQEIKTVFVIAMENHNWTQPANQFTGGIQQIYQNPAAPFVNSLVNGTAFVSINGSLVNISSQSRLRYGLPQRAGDPQWKQCPPSSFRAQLSMGGGRHKF